MPNQFVHRIWPTLLCLLALLITPLTVHAKDDPILMIDTGGHKAMIMDVIFTSDGRYLISASEDKTIRVWNVRTGKIHRIIRGQVGDGDEGKIFAAALSPDNQWLAVGGLLTGDLLGETAIRLYHYPSGELVSLLKGHQNVILSLAFSPDSRKLASGSGDFTVRIWDVPNKKPLHTLTGHTNHVFALGWMPDGKRLVSGAYDNTLILWDAKRGKLINHMQGHENKVQSLAISPDGRYIASGSKDKTIRLWDGQSGAPVKVLAKQNRAVASLSFSPDGRTLLSGVGGGTGVRENTIYTIPSGKVVTTFDQHKNTVLATAFSPDGRLVATGGGSDQEIYLWNPKDGQVKHKLVGKGSSVWSVGFSQDGNAIAWGNKVGNKWTQNNYGPLQQWLTLGHDGSTSRVSYQGELSDTAAFLRGVDQQDRYQLRVKKGGDYGYADAILEIVRQGKVIAAIERGSTDGLRHRSFSLTPDNRHLASGGSNGVLNLYETKTGSKVHDFIGHTGDVWAVAVSPDGRQVVSGSADQTVRVWDLESGENLLTVFVGSDEEWVAWTPSGYYTSSPNGDRYIVWQINKGADQNAEYYTAAQFAHLFYRPEIVAATVRYGSEQQALAKLGKDGGLTMASLQEFAPPELTILSPQPGFSTSDDYIILEVKIDTKKSPLQDLAVYVNGRQTQDGKQRRPSGIDGSAIKHLRVPLHEQNNTIRVVATNKHNATADAMLEVMRTMAISKSPEGDLYLLAVGVNKLDNIPGNNLDFPAKDAGDIARVMGLLEGSLFRKVHTTLLSDFASEKPTSDNVVDALDLLRKARSNDTVMIFLAGHVVTVGSNDFYFLTRDAKMRGNNDYRGSSVLKWSVVRDSLQWLNARRILLMDTCYSGGVDMTDMLKKGSDSNMTVLASSTGNQTSQESKKVENGYFTHAILKGLGNGLPADYNKDNQVEVMELAMYVKNVVKKLSNKQQTPNLALPAGLDDFPFYLKVQ